MSAKLRASVVRMVGVRVLSVATNLIALVAYSRLLHPTDFGHLAMIATTVQLANLFRDFGLTTATVQKDTLSQKERDATFWLNTLIVSIITAVLVAASWPVAAFYKQPSLVWLLIVSAFSFFVIGLSSQHAAVLRRALNFAAVARAEALSSLCGLVVGICVAMWLRNAWAFVLATLLQGIVAAQIIYAADRWRPGGPSLRAGASSFHFGAHITFYNILNFFSNNITQVLLGRLYGPAPLGQFNRAQQLFWLPHNLILAPTASVMLPALARSRIDPAAADDAYRQFHRRMSLLFIPAACVLPAISEPLVRVSLGEGWAEAGKILGWFAFALAAHGVVNPGGTYLMALGRTRIIAVWGVFDLLLRGGGAVLGLHYGPVGAAAGFSIATIVFAAPATFFMISHKRQITFRDQLVDTVPGLFIGSLLGLLSQGLRLQIASLPSLLQLLVVLGACGTSFAVIAAIVPPIRRDILAAIKPQP